MKRKQVGKYTWAAKLISDKGMVEGKRERKKRKGGKKRERHDKEGTEKDSCMRHSDVEIITFSHSLWSDTPACVCVVREMDRSR